jgi:hypothetical protein
MILNLRPGGNVYALMMKVSIPVEKGNATISDGSLAKTMASILGEFNPEAADFMDKGWVFLLDLTDTSQIPAVGMDVNENKGDGGERGIRTLDTVSRIHAFQACAFSHSAISPLFL